MGLLEIDNLVKRINDMEVSVTKLTANTNSVDRCRKLHPLLREAHGLRWIYLEFDESKQQLADREGWDHQSERSWIDRMNDVIKDCDQLISHCVSPHPWHRPGHQQSLLQAGTLASSAE